MGGGIIGEAIPGFAIGAGIAVGAPFIQQYVPAIGPMNSSTVAVLGGGVAAKFLHKGGKFATAAVILGSAMAAHDLMSSMGGTGVSGSMTYY